MRINRVKKSRDFTILSNSIFRTNISLKARGLYCQIMSLPDDWELSIKGLETLLPDGRRSISGAMQELVSIGLARFVKYHNGTHLEQYWEVFEEAQNVNAQNVNAQNVNAQNVNAQNVNAQNVTQYKYLLNKELTDKELTNKTPLIGEDVKTPSAVFENEDESISEGEKQQAETQPLNADLDLNRKEEKQKKHYQTLKASKLDYANDAEFCEWWEAYPPGRKQDKPDVYRRFCDVRKAVPFDILLKAAKDYRSYCEHQAKTNTNFPGPRMPATWLNKGSWDSEYQIPKTNAQGASKRTISEMWEGIESNLNASFYD